MPSSSTSARDAPLAPTPRSDTPCDVGFAMRLPERRKSVKPGTCRSASSVVGAAVGLHRLARDHDHARRRVGQPRLRLRRRHHDRLRRGRRRCLGIVDKNGTDGQKSEHQQRVTITHDFTEARLRRRVPARAHRRRRRTEPRPRSRRHGQERQARQRFLRVRERHVDEEHAHSARPRRLRRLHASSTRKRTSGRRS